MDEPMMDEAFAEAEHGTVGNDTHAARWARPELQAFSSKEKAITFQVRFGCLGIFVRPRRKLTIMISDKSPTHEVTAASLAIRQRHGVSCGCASNA